MIPSTQLNVIAPVGSVTAFSGYVQPPPEVLPPYPPAPDHYNTYPLTQGFSGLNAEAYGWMVCDGRQLDPAQYPDLFNMIGFLYNQQGDTFNPDHHNPFYGGPPDPHSNVLFRIPDYRGYFLRMVSGTDPWPGGKNPDPDANNRTTTYGSSSTGIGSLQRDAMQDHQHSYNKSAMGAGAEGGGMPVTSPPQQENTSGPVSQSGQDISVSQENRPLNMYVYYLIRVL